MSFEPRFEITRCMLLQVKAIEQRTGFLTAVRLRPELIYEVRSHTTVRDVIASTHVRWRSNFRHRARWGLQ
jgi:hypothetical protein